MVTTTRANTSLNEARSTATETSNEATTTAADTNYEVSMTAAETTKLASTTAAETSNEASTAAAETNNESSTEEQVANSNEITREEATERREAALIKKKLKALGKVKPQGAIKSVCVKQLTLLKEDDPLRLEESTNCFNFAHRHKHCDCGVFLSWKKKHSGKAGGHCQSSQDSRHLKNDCNEQGRLPIASEKIKEDARALDGLKQKRGTLKRAAEALVESEELAADG